MHEIINAVILGIVEGITEFLPISSTGHLILVNQFIGFEEHFTKMFDIVIQLGAILSVVIFFRKKLFIWEFKSEHAKSTIELWKKVIIGVLPALFFGFLLADQIEALFFNPLTVAIALFLGGIALILLENFHKSDKIKSLEAISFKTAFFIGLIQCIAMIPGTSRSAATIIGAMLLGCSRIVAAEFSFFLAIPTIFAASSYSILKTGFNLTGHEALILCIGFIVSFLTAWLIIAVFMRFISKNNFKPFGYYRIILGLIVFYLLILKG